MMLSAVALSVGMFVAAGCGNGMSANPSLQLLADASETSIQVLGKRGLPDHAFELTSDEHLIATFRGVSQELELDETIPAYATVISIDSPVTSDEVIDLEYQSSDGSKTITWFAPPSFELDPIPDPSSRNAPLTISWAPAAGGQLELEVVSGGNCAAAEGPADDTGSLTLSALTLGIHNGTCQATLSLMRESLMFLDNNTSSVEFDQTRSRTFTSTP